MSLISNGIYSVRAFALPAGIRTDGQCVRASRVALLRWRSSWSDKHHQAYVNGRYAGTTHDCHHREMIIPTPTSLESPVRIEVFAVEPEHSHMDFSDELARPAVDSGRVRITLLRSQNIPADATAEIYFDNGTGQIDYNNPLTDSPIRVWPAWQDKAGFAMSQFGLGDFGYDSAAAIGFGKGTFGHGQFGFDADTIEWVSPPLPRGSYRFGVKLTDGSGTQGTAGETEPITVTPTAKPAEELSILSFDKQTNRLVLAVSNPQ
ncbi:MAG: hypothetical protein JSW66_02065 [Phycisphaerales bacterium]|nr:MAG: hypothetical protein JSW66_02065 [Phycisphaerales bacterium]